MTPQGTALEIGLLGPFQVIVVGQPPANFTSDKVRALLAYLAVRPNQAHRRETLAGLLWPESPERAARASLRNALPRLRHILDDREADPPLLEITAQTITFSPSARCQIDTLRLERLLNRSSDKGEFVDRFQEAVALYRGPFLEGFSLPGCEAYEEWLTIQREHNHRLVIDALGVLAQTYETQGKLAEAIELVRHQIELEPWLETGHRRLMRLLAMDERRSEALGQFDRCRRTLATELGVPPEEKTVALYRQLRDEVGLPQSGPQPRNRLPSFVSPLIGREREMAELGKLLVDPERRLVSVVGAGGMGKTHLATEVARQQAERFPDGVVFVPLAPIDDVTDVTPAICRALALPIDGSSGAKNQLMRHLVDKRLLIVLDNLEHLLPARTDIAEILQVAPRVRILCTSRERLDLRNEQIYALQGLTVSSPSPGSRPDEIDSSDALMLFSQSARRVLPGFTYTSQNGAVAASICRALDGLPLGIILAASWIELLSPAEIKVQITSANGQIFDLLSSEHSDVPSRHRSLRAVLDSSWVMLSDQEQAIVAALSIFRGGFTFESAASVTGITHQGMRRLVAKSMIQVEQQAEKTIRYQMHEYLRQYAAEQLSLRPDGEDQARSRHAGYFVSVLRTVESAMQGMAQQSAVRALSDDAENLRIAWRWLVLQRDVGQLHQALDPLCRYTEWQGRAMDGEAVCTLAIEHLGVPSSPNERRLLAKLCAWQSMFSRVMGHERAAETRQRQAVDLLDTLAAAGEIVDAERAFINLNLGLSALYTDDLATVEKTCTESRALSHATGDRWSEAQAIEVLGWSSHNAGRYERCLDQCLSALRIRRQLGDTRGTAASLMGIGMASARLGRFDESLAAFNAAVEGWQTCGDRRTLAGTFSQMASLWTWMGNPERGCSYSGEAFAILRDLGLPMWLALEQCVSGFEPYLHSGRYAEGHRILDDGLAIAREQGSPWQLGAGLVRRAKLNIVESDWKRAIELLDEALPLLRSIERLDEIADGEFALAACMTFADKVEEAEAHLNVGLQIATKIDHFALRRHGEVASVLLATKTENPGLAIERYAIVMADPFVANSCWFADALGQIS